MNSRIIVVATIASLSVMMAGICVPADADTKQGPTADQRAAYERGREYQRIVFDLQDPSVCFIAALRPRVETDLMACRHRSCD